MKALVTVIMPNYNSHKTLIRAVKSVEMQSFENWKLIIVDDNSNIQTKKILLKLNKNKKIKVYFLNKNKGAGYCRNFAIKKSKSKYLAFLDSDDFWKKNKLFKQLNYMIKNEYHFTYTFYKTINKFKIKKIFTPLKFNFNTFINNTSIATSSMIVKRFTDKKIKFLNTSSCDDYYFKCALLKKYKYAYCVPKFMTYYQIRANSVQSSRLKNLFWVWKTNSKHNNLSIIKNIISLFNISLNSLKKYGFK